MVAYSVGESGILFKGCAEKETLHLYISVRYSPDITLKGGYHKSFSFFQKVLLGISNILLDKPMGFQAKRGAENLTHDHWDVFPEDHSLSPFILAY